MNITGEVKFLGDGYPGCYANGLSMHDSETMGRFTCIEKDEKKEILETDNHIRLSVVYETGKHENVKVVTTSIKNESDKDVTLEMITSFSIRGVKADKLHRMQSFWSEEGRHRVEDLVDLGLEKSWAGHGMRVLKYGNLGSMPVRSYFPFIALEDSTNHHFIAVTLYSPSSWQMEVISHRDDTYIISGGIADRDYGQWMKTLKPHETFVAPKAVIAEGNSLLDVCNLLVKEQTPDISKVDNHMGITFNEYCTTWGDPSMTNLKKIADKLAGKGIQYLVMDSGWYLDEGQNWWDYIGNWKVNKKRFPNGLKELSSYIRAKGMIPGIWFEPESLATGSPYYHDKEYILQKDGYPLTVGGKRFLDMESQKVRDFLRKDVIGLLKENDFGYVKIDYNDTIGAGCDGKESLGENLRRKVLASQDFLREIKKEIPDIVIENCSSGGHRLEASMMELASMASFSDAHETTAIPLIAGSLQMMVAPMQNQIWSVLRKEDSDDRIYYSMVSTFLGRMGLSGDIYDLSEHQWELIDKAIAFYKEAADIIKYGKTTVLEHDVHSWNQPCGSQLVVREFETRSLVILHRFAHKEGEDFSLPKIITKLGSLRLEYGSVDREFSAKAWIFEKTAS